MSACRLGVTYIGRYTTGTRSSLHRYSTGIGAGGSVYIGQHVD